MILHYIVLLLLRKLIFNERKKLWTWLVFLKTHFVLNTYLFPHLKNIIQRMRGETTQQIRRTSSILPLTIYRKPNFDTQKGRDAACINAWWLHYNFIFIKRWYCFGNTSLTSFSIFFYFTRAQLMSTLDNFRLQ